MTPTPASTSDDLTIHRAHPSELNLYYRNARIGNVPAIEASLQVLRQYVPILVNKGTHTGRPMEVLKGNHTLMAMRNLLAREPESEDWSHVQFVLRDVDNDTAARIVAADNRTSELGTFDDRLLLELLADLDELDGTGYDEGDLAALEEAVNSEGVELEAGDDKAPGSPVISYTLVFDDDAQQDLWFELLRYLKRTYPNEATIASRLHEWLHQFEVQIKS